MLTYFSSNENSSPFPYKTETSEIHAHHSEPNSSATSSMSLSWTHHAGESPWRPIQVWVVALLTPHSVSRRQTGAHEGRRFLPVHLYTLCIQHSA